MPTPAEDLKAARTKLLELNRAFRAALRDAQNADPRTPDNQPLYSANGLQQHRAELAEKVRDTYRPQFIDLLERTEASAVLVAASAARALPKLGDDAASQMVMQRRWDQTVQRLEAGMTLRDVVATADRDTLLAIREWGPTYLEAKDFEHHRAPGRALFEQWQPPDTSALMRAIDARFAELLDKDAATAIRDRLETGPQLDAFRVAIRHAASVVDGDLPDAAMDLEAAVAAEYAAQPPTLAAPEDDLADPAPVAS